MKAFRTALLAAGALLALAVAYVLAHGALIEAGNEVVVLRTQNEDGFWATARGFVSAAGSVRDR